MVGHGSPLPALALFAGAMARAPRHLALLPPALLAAWLLVALPAQAETTDLRLRIAWGGGESRQWRGTVRVSEGELSAPRPLGLEPDEPGSMTLRDGVLAIAPRTPRGYDGVDLMVRAPLEAKLRIDLTPDNQPAETRQIEVALREIIHQPNNAQLDDRGNGLLIRRAPGDRLRVRIDRDSLVFTTGETFTFHAAPHLADLPEQSSLRCTVELLRGRSSSVLWSTSTEFETGEDGQAPELGPFEVELPQQEGVYDIVVSLSQRRLATPFVRKRILERKVQVVALGRQAPPSDAQGEWSEVAEIDPAHPDWMERLSRLPRLEILPGFDQAPISNGKTGRRDHGGRTIIELPPGAWQAYQLPVGRVGRPHILEIEYPRGVRQTLGISIVEADAEGNTSPIGLDSGVDVAAATAEQDSPGFERHRLVFWPKTEQPLVLLTNRRDDRPALFGRMRVLAGPEHLPPLDNAAMASSNRQPNSERLWAAYFEKPLFPENFGAGEALDPATGRTLDDWVTFYEGGRRLVEYLKYAGYNGAVVAVACEGSALYPSRWLDPTPKYDTGVFFVSAQDPMRKDVLEMLLRMFDRAGLRLIPSVQMASPLPELEELQNRAGGEAAGVQLVGGDGRSWLASRGSRHGLAPYYNPLDERVQTAVRRVAAELTGRYGSHPAFAGVALQLGPDSYLNLPGPAWALDDETFAQFRRALGLPAPGGGIERFQQRADYVRGKGREAWLDWRARRLAEFHLQLAADLRENRPDAKLYLLGADLVTSSDARQLLQPRLTGQSTAGAMLALGVDPRQYARREEIVMPRPQRLAPLVRLGEQGPDLEWNRSGQVDALFNGASSSAVFYHESLPLQLPGFNAASPFGPRRTRTFLAAHVSPGGIENRRRFVHAVAALETHALIDGGWMTPLGQEETLQSIVAAYRALPAQEFQTVRPVSGSNAQPVVVRRLSGERGSWIYLVNDSPWPVRVTVRLSGAQTANMEPLGGRRIPPPAAREGGVIWRLELQPYDLVGARFDSPQVEVDRWDVDVPAAVTASLEAKVRDVRERMGALRRPPPIDVLQNPGFEAAGDAQPLPGWVRAQAEGLHFAADASESHSGQTSLHMQSNGPVAWIRSDPFQPPATGRLAVWAWIKVEDPENPPRLQLAIEGRLHGETYYRHGALGAGDNAIPFKSGWAPYLLQVDDLPLEGLTDLRVGFDLMGAGRVWVDDVRLYDLWFYDNERDELLKTIAAADLALTSGDVADCQRFLEGYWPRFLLEYAPPPRPKDVVDRSPDNDSPAARSADQRSTWRKLRDKLMPF